MRKRVSIRRLGLAATIALLAVPRGATAEPHMLRGTITVTPDALSRAAVRLQFDRAKYALKSCYSKRLARNNSLRGTVVAQFVVRRDGSVVRSRATGIKNDVAGCVARTVSTLRFDKPNKRVRVRVELHYDTNKYRIRRRLSKTATIKLLGSGQRGTVGTLYTSKRNLNLKLGTALARLKRRAPPTPRVRMGAVRATSGIDKAIIRRYLRRHRAAFRACYVTRLKAVPKLSGRVRFVFTIGPNGKVSSARTKGLDKRVARCLRRALGRIHFPKPRGGGVVKVGYPMYFSRPARGIGRGSGRGTGYGLGRKGTATARRNRHGGGVVTGSIINNKRILPRGHVRLKRVVTSSGYKASAAKTVRRHLGMLRSCYKRALARKSRLQGTVHTRLYINPAGRVISARSYGVHTLVSGCIAAKVKRMRFPRPKTKTKRTFVRFSLELRAR